MLPWAPFNSRGYCISPSYHIFVYLSSRKCCTLFSVNMYNILE
nr:MAG TPA: hypothetical protein [Caudoviricetes sp.]